MNSRRSRKGAGRGAAAAEATAAAERRRRLSPRLPCSLSHTHHFSSILPQPPLPSLMMHASAEPAKCSIWRVACLPVAQPMTRGGLLEAPKEEPRLVPLSCPPRPRPSPGSVAASSH